MNPVEYTLGRTLLIRADHDSDLVQFITELAKAQGITAATFTAIGALKTAKVGYYDQKKHEYREHELAGPREIISCIGNISLKDDEPFVHAHVALADEGGSVKAGHLLEGTVFAAEIHLTELKGEKIQRKKDEVTGLALWEK